MLKFIEHNGDLTCIFGGSLDARECLKIESQFDAKMKTAQKMIVFDLSFVTFVSSMFLRLCIKAAKTVGAERFKIVNVPDQIMDVFKFAALDRLVRIE